jgi:hypothetical protein
MEHLLAEVFKRANQYIKEVQTRRVSPSPEAIAGLKRLDIPLQDQPMDALTVLAELDDYGSAATVACTGGRYFGFVTGGSLPAALTVNMLAAVWFSCVRPGT